MQSNSVRLLAFYLPQFHPIPENDTWWGKGFTEWTNVARARPLFPGHYQPHIPADLGFYDLRLPEVRQAQADLAREYGIGGFVYYHYWFNGKRLLEGPFDQVLSSGRPDFPFCLCWANESWTRAWDGHSDEILMPQSYSEADDREHIRWLARAFQDPRYIRVQNKPLILIYAANKLPHPRRTSEIWREEAQKLGLGELFLCRVESYADEVGNPGELGLDAAVEFQPDWKHLSTPRAAPLYGDLRVYEYMEIMQQQLAKPASSYPRFPGVTPSWDNSPRRLNKAIILAGSNPALYEIWLRAAIQKARQQDPGEGIVFINAWNEWGEGNHLEPDWAFGRGYLEATRRALSGDVTSPAPMNASSLIGDYRTYTSKLEQELLSLQQKYQELERWAHELEQSVLERGTIIQGYERKLGPLLKVTRALGAKSNAKPNQKSAPEHIPAAGPDQAPEAK